MGGGGGGELKTPSTFRSTFLEDPGFQGREYIPFTHLYSNTYFRLQCRTLRFRHPFPFSFGGVVGDNNLVVPYPQA